MPTHMPSGPVNRNFYPDAPASDGPDIDHAKGEFYGFPVLARRVRGGHWCGYLTVPATHPWVKASLDDKGRPDEWRLLPLFEVHGSCTYAEMDDDGALTVGFDCAHSLDEPPPWRQQGWLLGHATTEGYRDLEYVRRELLGLARQAADVAAAKGLVDGLLQASGFKANPTE